jgi:predicted naringenin-chalcone synthase
MNLPRLLGIGTAVPPNTLSQADAARHASVQQAGVPASSGVGSDTDHVAGNRSIRALYRRAGVRSRGSVLLGDGGTLDAFFPTDARHGPSTGDRLAVYRRHAGGLARRAAGGALVASGVSPDAITHLVTASCTGFDAPGVDFDLIEGLRLPRDVRRTHVGFMGCHAAVNALAVASAFASQDPGLRVLVCCVELCSLHYSYEAEPDRRVANALFADGAAAAVVGAATSTRAPAIRGFASTVLPDSADLMSWSIGNHGFEMRLSPRVPDRLAEEVPAWIEAMLRTHRLTIPGIRSWAIHPGGPRVLGALTEALDLPEGSDEHSRAVLASHGNMSSATVLFIIDRLLRDRAREGSALPLLAAAFGPGLAGEAMLLTDP